jgi:hypothetical protein
MANQASMASFVEYTNRKANEQGSALNEAFKKSFAKTVEINNLIPKDERGILNNIEYVTDPIAEVMGQHIAEYMRDEDRAFELSAPDEKTCSATLKLVAKEKETKTGTIQFGPNAGQEYTTTIDDHTEYAVKNRRDKFKK